MSLLIFQLDVILRQIHQRLKARRDLLYARICKYANGHMHGNVSAYNIVQMRMLRVSTQLSE